MPTFNTTIEVDVVVHYDAIPACKGSRDSYGVPQEPDEPGHIEITRCYFPSDNLVLSDAQKRDIEDQIAEHLADERDYYATENSDSMRDER